MMISGGSKVAVSEFNLGAMHTEHYKSRMDAVEGILLSSGEDGFAAFMSDVLPRIQKRWNDSMERDRKNEELRLAINKCSRCELHPDGVCEEHDWEVVA